MWGFCLPCKQQLEIAKKNPFFMERVKSGVEGMDTLLGGGLPKYRSILLSGHCGTGKTIFAAQFINEGLRNKEPAVYITFEQGRKKLIEDLSEIGIGFEKHEKAGLLKIIGGPIGQVNYFKDKTRADVSNIISEIKEVIEETRAKRVVLDSVNLYTMLFEGYIDRRKALAGLVSALEKLDCTTLLTCEVRENSRDISWYGFEDFVVDGVIALHRIPFDEGMYERAVSVVKMRGIEHAQTVRALRIKDTGMKIYPEQIPFHR